jgi:DNA invertase Pin-like site-specific DNA recombinase
MRVAIYVRVSTAAQSSEMQKEEILRYIQARGWSVGLTYEDVASGTKDDRPALKRLLKDAHLGRFAGVVVWKLDRFGRSVRHLVNTIHELTSLNIGFISVRDHIDLTTPAGRMMLTMLAAIAEFEAELIRERVRAGVQSKIARTGKWGRIKGTGKKDGKLVVYDIPKLEKLLFQDKLSLSRAAEAVGCSKGFALSVRRQYLKRSLSEERPELQSSGSSAP